MAYLYIIMRPKRVWERGGNPEAQFCSQGGNRGWGLEGGGQIYRRYAYLNSPKFFMRPCPSLG